MISLLKVLEMTLYFSDAFVSVKDDASHFIETVLSIIQSKNKVGIRKGAAS